MTIKRWRRRRDEDMEREEGGGRRTRRIKVVPLMETSTSVTPDSDPIVAFQFSIRMPS